MKFLNILIALVVLIFTIGANAITCPTGQQPCGDSKCYNPSTSNCLPGNIICLWGYELCGTQCYNPSSTVCKNGVICQWGYEVCNKTCYNPSSGSTCYANGLLCPYGKSQCYAGATTCC